MYLSFSGSPCLECTEESILPEFVLDECSIMLTFWDLYAGPLRRTTGFPTDIVTRIAAIRATRLKNKHKRKQQNGIKNGRNK